MKIAYDETKRSIRIDDGTKQQYFLLKGMMILTLLNSSIYLYNLSNNHFQMMGFFWIIIAVTSAIILSFLFLKMNTAEIIALDDISHFKEKKMFGRRRIHLRLKNGKKRNLITKSNSEASEAKELLERMGIRTTKS